MLAPAVPCPVPIPTVLLPLKSLSPFLHSQRLLPCYYCKRAIMKFLALSPGFLFWLAPGSPSLSACRSHYPRKMAFGWYSAINELLVMGCVHFVPFSSEGFNWCHTFSKISRQPLETYGALSRAMVADHLGNWLHIFCMDNTILASYYEYTFSTILGHIYIFITSTIGIK